ncbi:hypothetical protein ACFYWD_25115 [Streptomyces sp. NPDC003781]|uniref:hypothetical protein n=1 Tax=Streptomyces sp. NPDC003781 TaxID=3364686 RepID=UPI0036853FFF
MATLLGKPSAKVTAGDSDALTQVTEAGGIIYPVIPTYYNLPESVEQMFEEFTERLLGFAGLDQSDYYAWRAGGSRASVERAATRTAPRRGGGPSGAVALGPDLHRPLQPPGGARRLRRGRNRTDRTG